MNGMIFRSFRKRNSSQKNTNTVYSEYSYSGIVPKERALSLFTQACVFFDIQPSCFIQQMNCNVLAAMVSAPVCPVLLVFAVTPVLLSTTGIPLARAVSSASATVVALLVVTVMILGSARVGPTLVAVSVIDVLMVTMDL